VSGMKSGAVIVDISAEGGGNCELTQPGETIRAYGITIVAPLNVASRLAADASELYAKNQFNLLGLMLHDNIVTIDWTDEVLAKTALTHDGKLCDPGTDPKAKPAKHPAGAA
jgi:NAD(P) transhydrogenase subunit alpha